MRFAEPCITSHLQELCQLLQGLTHVTCWVAACRRCREHELEPGIALRQDFVENIEWLGKVRDCVATEAT